MKVLWIPAWFPHKENPQLGNFYFQKANALSSQVKLTVVTFNRTPPPHLHYNFRWVNFSGEGLGKLTALLKWYRFIKKALKDHERIHILSYSAIFRLLKNILRVEKIPFFYSESWSGILTGHKEGLAQRSFFLQNATTVFTPSLKLADAIRKSGFPPPEIIPDIIDAGEKKAAPREDLKPYGIMICDMVDRLKGIGEVINAWKSLKPEMNLVLIGDGPDFKKLLNQASNVDTIHFLGRKDQPAAMEFLHHASFLIQNSAVETFGMVAVEALACGKPIVYRKVGILEEIDSEGIGVEIHESVSVALSKMLSSFHKFEPSELMKKAEPFSEAEFISMIMQAYQSLQLE